MCTSQKVNTTTNSNQQPFPPCSVQEAWLRRAPDYLWSSGCPFHTLSPHHRGTPIEPPPRFFSSSNWASSSRNGPSLSRFSSLAHSHSRTAHPSVWYFFHQTQVIASSSSTRARFPLLPLLRFSRHTATPLHPPCVLFSRSTSLPFVHPFAWCQARRRYYIQLESPHT